MSDLRQQREDEERKCFVDQMMSLFTTLNENDRRFLRYAIDAAWVYGRNQALSRHGVVLRDASGRLLLPKMPKRRAVLPPREDGT